jgi:hypothetical protein
MPATPRITLRRKTPRPPATPVDKRLRRAAAAVGATGLALSAAMAGFGPATAQGSSHREAPLIAADPAVDNTDLYAFVSPDKPDTTTLTANFQPFEEPNGGPNFYPFATDAAYLINIDNDGDAKPDVIFRWRFKSIDKRGNDTFLYNNGAVTSFNDENLLFKQTYTLDISFDGGHKYSSKILNAPVAPSRVGKASMPNYAALRNSTIANIGGGFRSFAGQADDPFFADLRVFDLLYGGNLSEVGQDTLGGYNVNTLSIQVPSKFLALKGDAHRNPVVGIWSTTERNKVRISGNSKARLGSDTVQVSRLGNPLVNEVVSPAGLKDAFNALSPDQDHNVKALVDRVTDPELPKLIESIYKIPAPETPRNDLAEIFLTGLNKQRGGPIPVDLNSQVLNKDANAKKFVASEMLRLNLCVTPAAKPNRLGVLGGDTQGFPNGRRLTDDVIDISIQAMEGAAQSGKLVQALAAGDKVNANDVSFEKSFPYVAEPNQYAVNQGGAAPAVKKASDSTSLGTTGKISAMSAAATTALIAGVLAIAAWYRRRPTVAAVKHGRRLRG